MRQSAGTNSSSAQPPLRKTVATSSPKPSASPCGGRPRPRSPTTNCYPDQSFPFGAGRAQPPYLETHSKRHGDLSGQLRNASAAHAVLLSVWHVVQGFGILYLSVIAGVMKAKVWARTFTSAMVVSIFGI